MNYATVADMVARFGETEVIQISDRDMTHAVNNAVIDQALADATAEINGYLGRYPLPFTDVPIILNRLCCDIARYRLSGVSSVQMTEETERRYNVDVLNLLKGLANGTVTLGIKPTGEQVDTGDTVQFVNNKNRVFSRDN